MIVLMGQEEISQETGQIITLPFAYLEEVKETEWGKEENWSLSSGLEHTNFFLYLMEIILHSHFNSICS